MNNNTVGLTNTTYTGPIDAVVGNSSPIILWLNNTFIEKLFTRVIDGWEYLTASIHR